MNEGNNKIYELEQKFDPRFLEFMEQKLIALEDRSRQSNIRIDGVPERDGETWDQC